MCNLHLTNPICSNSFPLFLNAFKSCPHPIAYTGPFVRVRGTRQHKVLPSVSRVKQPLSLSLQVPSPTPNSDQVLESFIKQSSLSLSLWVPHQTPKHADPSTWILFLCQAQVCETWLPVPDQPLPYLPPSPHHGCHHPPSCPHWPGWDTQTWVIFKAQSFAYVMLIFPHGLYHHHLLHVEA